MSKGQRYLLGAIVSAATLLPAMRAHAQCCPGYTAASACDGVTMTKSRWCIQDTAPTHQAALPKAFCSYGDKVVDTLEKTFNIKAPDTFEFELDTQTGGAHTGTACQHFGDGVAYDAFVGQAYGATGFWGYLLAMHEAINDWTGLASSGWPTDWWADHQSAFPNLMDFHIMNTVGVANSDMNLITAAAAQKKRFYPGGDSSDAKVVALDNVYAAMPNGDGFAGFSHMFALLGGDGVKWDSLGVPNPDVKRSEYVTAYMSLATGKSVLTTLQGPGANSGGKICNNTPDGTASDAPYTCSSAHVDAIASAHCSIAANNKPAADLTKLRGGNYDVASGPCGATCPSECACDANKHCVAAWLGTPPTTGNGGSGGMTGGVSNGGMSAGGASSGGASNGGTSAGGAPNAGATSGGNASSGAPAGGATTGTGGSAGSGVAGANSPGNSGAGAGATDAGSDSNSGCSCRTAGNSQRQAPLAGLLLASLLLGLRVRSTRARRRTR